MNSHNYIPMGDRRQGGFTLVELMIVVVIVAIFATVVLPSYKNAMMRGRRASAEAYLVDIAQRQQQYLMDSRSYAATLGLQGLNITAPPEVAKYYDVYVTPIPGPPPGFAAIAAPKTGSAQEDDKPLSINNLGEKNPTDHGYWSN